MSVYTAIVAVTRELSAGISKDRSAQALGYKFRGIDDVLNAVSPALAKHGLCMLPRVVDRVLTERVAKSGLPMFYVCLTVEYDLVADDGSKHTIRVMGEGFDSSDKATNKAMSACYKYAAVQAFCIPVEGVAVDSEKDHHEAGPAPGYPWRSPPVQTSGSVAADVSGPSAAVRNTTPPPRGPDEGGTSLDALKQQIADADTTGKRKAVRDACGAWKVAHPEDYDGLLKLYGLCHGAPNGQAVAT